MLKNAFSDKIKNNFQNFIPPGSKKFSKKFEMGTGG
jgi:hypothetical protein